MSSTLKCATLWFGITPDMIETPLRSMTNSGIWKSIMSPVRSTIIFVAWTLNVEYPLLLPYDTWLVRDLISGISYPIQSHYRHNTFTRSRDIASPWPSHMLASLIDATSPSGPTSIYPLSGLASPALDAYASMYLFRYLRHIFIITLLLRDVWCNQSNLED